MRITRTKYFDKSFFELEKSNPKVIHGLLRKIQSLQEWNLRNESLIWFKDLYKIRVWKYRLIYTIQSWVLIILLAVRKREIAYKNLDKILKSIDIKK